MKKLVLRCRQFKIMFLICFFRAMRFFRKSKYWVVYERGTDARDNGYFFYKFLKARHPEIKVFYIIDKASPDFYKVKDNAVHFGSLKNYRVLANAEKIISTHYCSGVPNLDKNVFLFLRLDKKFYWLQHGIIKDYIPGYSYAESPMRLFVCGAKPEWEYIRTVFGYPESVAKYTGLARYDNLHDIKTTNTILLMPTWRDYIKNGDKFKKSEYLKQWQSVLNDERLIKLLEENDLKLIFYPHYEFQKYIDMFEVKSDHIILAHFADYDVQTLLKEAKILVTDYSSVFFDFGYMGKPIVYFQFDKEDFYAKHYQKGYFSFEEMGFGPVCEISDSTIACIENYTENAFEAEEIYKQRTGMFFALRDKHNCERIFDAIMGI